MHHDETQILVLTCRGDQAAARVLWDRHGPALLAYARAILGPPAKHQAEDVVQTVLCAILRASPRSLRQVRDVHAWLSVAVRRAALNTLRSRGRAGRRARSTAAPPLDLPSGQGVESTELARAVDRLPRRLREVLYLKLVGDLTFDQIAASLCRSRSTCSSQYQSALDLLRGSLQHDQAHALPRNPATLNPTPPSPAATGVSS